MTCDDDGALQFLAVANAAAEDILDQGFWTVLEKVYVFNSVAGQQEYPLPDDYGNLVIDTVWDRSQLTPMQGPLSPALWQTIKSGLIGNGIYFTRYRVVRSVSKAAKVFVVDPPSPNTGSPLVFEYQSNQFAVLADGSATNDKFLNDTDTCIFPTKLLRRAIKWRWRREKQLEWATYLEEYNQLADTMIVRDRPQPGFSLAGPDYRQNFLGWNNIPDTGFGNS